VLLKQREAQDVGGAWPGAVTPAHSFLKEIAFAFVSLDKSDKRHERK
jgi:hypothetical protein